MSVYLFVYLFVSLYAGDGRPNGWADQDQTWHGDSCRPRERFRQGQGQGHVVPNANKTPYRGPQWPTEFEREAR